MVPALFMASMCQTSHWPGKSKDSLQHWTCSWSGGGRRDEGTRGQMLSRRFLVDRKRWTSFIDEIFAHEWSWMCRIKIGKIRGIKGELTCQVKPFLYSSLGNVANKSLLHSDVWMSIPKNSVGTCWNIEFGVKVTGTAHICAVILHK